MIATRDKHKYGVCLIVSSRDSSLFAVGCGDGRIRLWDAKTAKEAGTFGKKVASIEEAEPLHALSFLPGDKELLAVALDGSLQRWDIKTGKAKSMPLKHPDDILTAGISPDCGIIATGDKKGVVRLWDTKTGHLLTTFEEHTKGIHALVFNAAGTMLASGGSDQLIKLWKVPQRDRK